MEQNLAMAIMFVTLLIAITIVIIAILNYRIQSKIVKSGLSDENSIRALANLYYDFKVNTLKWGIILFFSGTGLIVLNFVPYNINSTLPYGIETVFLSAGFIGYYLFSKKHNSNP